MSEAQTTEHDVAVAEAQAAAAVAVAEAQADAAVEIAEAEAEATEAVVTTVASYEERLNECQQQMHSLHTSLEQEKEWRDSALNALQTQQAEMAASLSLIQSALETEPATPVNQPEAVPEEVTTPEKTDQPSADDKPAAEPEPVKERRRAHRWI